MNIIDLFDYVGEDNRWGIPTMERQDFPVEKVFGFNYVMNKPQYDAVVHFFLLDKEFERVWNIPEKYVPLLSQFPGLFTPDWSLFIDAARVTQIWNTYRNRVIGCYWQEQGLNVIPTVSWSDEESWDYCFCGIEKGSPVALSTRGTLRNGEKVREDFLKSFKEMVRRLEPSKVYIYGKVPEAVKELVDIQSFDYHVHF